MELSRGEDFLIHPPGPHDVQDHSVVDLSNDPCRVASGNIATQALIDELMMPGSGSPDVDMIPGNCPMGLPFADPCTDGGALDCMKQSMADAAVFLSTPV